MKKVNLRYPILILVSLAFVVVIIFLAQSVYVKVFQEDISDFEGKIDLGDFELYSCMRGKGKPTIIFESGHASTHETWNFIQQKISADNTTFSYDRAGIGLSDNSIYMRTSLNKAKELHKLLKQAEINGPYIIVSHSTGTWVSRIFAMLYGNELAGLIFVDPTHEDTNEFTVNSLSPELFESYNKEICKEGSYEDMLESISQIREVRHTMKTIPLTVISSNNHQMGAQFEEKWSFWQKDIASLSSYSEHITVNCGHNIQSENPDTIINAITEMVEKYK